MLDFFKKKEKETWKASFKNIGSAYSYSKAGDKILLQEPDTSLSEIQFNRKLEEVMYKFSLTKASELLHTAGQWQIELERK